MMSRNRNTAQERKLCAPLLDVDVEEKRKRERYLFPNSCLNVGEIFLFSFFPPSWKNVLRDSWYIFYGGGKFF